MPAPLPTEGESESEFMGRCMADEETATEFPDQGARAEARQRAFKDGASAQSAAPAEGA